MNSYPAIADHGPSALPTFEKMLTYRNHGLYSEEIAATLEPTS